MDNTMFSLKFLKVFYRANYPFLLRKLHRFMAIFQDFFDLFNFMQDRLLLLISFTKYFGLFFVE